MRAQNDPAGETPDQRRQQELQMISCDQYRIAIRDVAGRSSFAWPDNADLNSRIRKIMSDLGISIDGFRVSRVVPVNEDRDFLFGSNSCLDLIQHRFEILHFVQPGNEEMTCGIDLLSRPVDFSDFADFRNRHVMPRKTR